MNGDHEELLQVSCLRGQGVFDERKKKLEISLDVPISQLFALLDGQFRLEADELKCVMILCITACRSFLVISKDFFNENMLLSQLQIVYQCTILRYNEIYKLY